MYIVYESGLDSATARRAGILTCLPGPNFQEPLQEMAMTAKKTYYELLKDPRWQRKRLEIMQGADFKCERCDSGEAMLAVHHSYYEKGLMPWEYPDQSLHCLCEVCHKKAQDLHTLIQRQLGKLDAIQTEEAFGLLLGLQLWADTDAVADVFSYEVAMAMGMGKYFGLEAEMILGMLKDGQIDGMMLAYMESHNSRKAKGES